MSHTLSFKFKNRRRLIKAPIPIFFELQIKLNSRSFQKLLKIFINFVSNYVLIVHNQLI